MTRITSIVNPGGDWEETVVRLSKHLGQSQVRRAVFNVIYGRGTRAKSKKKVMELAGIKAIKSQQVQNELEHLHKHNLIRRMENDGSVDDGSKYLYDKDDFVRANRDAIVRRADNKALAQRTPTKRSTIATLRIQPLNRSRSQLRRRKHLSVLYLTSSPDEKHPLRVDVEMKLVQQAIRGSVYRDIVEFHFRPAADFDSILDGLNDHRPQIVHFSGHSDTLGIAGDVGSASTSASQDLSYDLLAKVISSTDTQVQVTVLNSCESAASRKILLEACPILIAMRTSVSDVAASAFAQRFYAGIASGQSVLAAYEQAVLAVRVISLGETDTPAIYSRSGIDPKKIILT